MDKTANKFLVGNNTNIAKEICKYYNTLCSVSGKKTQSNANQNKDGRTNFWRRKYIFSYFMDMNFGSSGMCLQTKLKYVVMSGWMGVFQEEQVTDS